MAEKKIEKEGIIKNKRGDFLRKVLMIFGYPSEINLGSILGILEKMGKINDGIKMKKFKKSLDFLKNLVILCYI
jgi:hypothetical protein